MPAHKVKEIDGKFWVVDMDGEPMGKGYPTREDAEAALEKMKPEDDGEPMGKGKPFAQAKSIRGLEIFRSGEWNGDEYGERDLDDLIAAFSKVGYRVPLKKGHKEESGGPAYGWVERIYRKGDRLLADIADIPAALYRAIKDRAYDAVSAEIYQGLKRGKETFRLALKAIALLGAEIPAVAGLKPIREVVHDIDPDEYEKVWAFTVQREEESDMPDSKKDTDIARTLEAKEKEVAELKVQLEAAQKTEATRIANLTQEVANLQEQRRQDEIRRIAESLKIPSLRKYAIAMADFGTSGGEKVITFTEAGKDGVEKKTEAKGFAAARTFVEEMNRHAAGLFRDLSQAEVKAREETPPPEDSHSAGEQLDKLTKEYVEKQGGKIEYRDAFAVVRKQHPALAKLYAQA